MEHTVRFTPRLNTVGAWQALLAAIIEKYPDQGVELKPAGDMKHFLLILPQETWAEEDGRFFDRLLYGSIEAIVTWEHLDC